MKPGSTVKGFTQTLVFRVAVMLSVALLPVGIIALMQTANVARQSFELNRSALYGRTVSDVEDMRDLLYGGYGSARVLATAVVGLRSNPAACSDLMNQLVRRSPVYRLAMFVDGEGRSTCNSDARTYDLASSEFVAKMAENRVPMADLLEKGRVTGKRVMVLGYPVFDDGRYLGFVSISITEQELSKILQLSVAPSGDQQAPIDLVTFTDRGRVVMSGMHGEQLARELPRDPTLASLAEGQVSAFSTQSVGGETRIYTLVPLIPGLVHAMAIWKEKPAAGMGWYSAALFPILMWLISLAVAYIAVHRLVLVHIRRLRARMIRFAAGHRGLSFRDARTNRAPREFKEMDETFVSMAETILHDEAELEDGLHEKNLLLREVHHRVKNNLQLITSIMNMEIRKAESDEARTTLRRILDRVLGLATVHSSLYQTSRLSVVHADSLLSTILRQTLSTGLPKEAGVRPKMQIADLTLAPEQAVPVALLTTEAVTNATKHMGAPDGPGSAWLKVRLETLAPEPTPEGEEDHRTRARLTIINSKGHPLSGDLDPPVSNGLGSQLIRAFAAQLGGELETAEDDESYCLSVTFPVEDQPQGAPVREIAPGERTVPPTPLPPELQQHGGGRRS